MARENHIVVSDEELEKLRDAREDIFGSEEVPYGVVIERLVEERGGGGD